MATKSNYITPGFDVEMIPIAPSNQNLRSPSSDHEPLYPTEDDSYATLISHDDLSRNEPSGMGHVAPAEYFSVLPSVWKRTRGLSPWAVPEVTDNLGELAYEARLSSMVKPEIRMVDKRTGEVAYTASPNGMLDWKNPFDIHVGGGEVNKLAPPYATVVRTLTVPGAKMHVHFPSGDTSLELVGNWNKREWTISRGTDVIATLKRKFNTCNYTIESGENIPFLHLIVQIVCLLIARDR